MVDKIIYTIMMLIKSLIKKKKGNKKIPVWILLTFEKVLICLGGTVFIRDKDEEESRKNNHINTSNIPSGI